MVLLTRKYPVDLIFLIVISHSSILIGANGESTVFLVQPGPETVYAPVNSTVEFNCTVMSEVLEWVVLVTDFERPLLFGSAVDRNRLSNRGISQEPPVLILSGTVATSLLRVPATAMNNGTMVVCRTLVNGEVEESTKATVIVYGVLSVPAVTLSDVGVGRVNVSWSTVTLPEVDTHFELTVLNLNTSQEITIPELNETHHIYTVSDDSSHCDVYQFTVTAANGAGTSSPSEAITRMLPSLPWINPSSIKHTITKTEGELCVNITFGPAGACCDYPVTIYTVTVMNAYNDSSTYPIADGARGDTMTLKLGPAEEVEENQLYSYYISASNEVGRISSNQNQYYTTDVQSVQMVKHNNGSTTICCRFITGTNAKGCLVGLVDRTGSVEYHRLDRSDGTQFARGLVISSLQECIFALDIESDGTNGTLEIPGTTGTCRNEDVEEPTYIEPAGQGISRAIVIVIAVVATIVLIIFLVVVMIGGTVYLILRNRRKGSQDELEMSANEAYGHMEPKETVAHHPHTEELVYDDIDTAGM